MAECLQPVTNLFKLVEACNRCSAVFRLTAQHVPDESLQQIADRVRQILDRFAFELESETGRNGHFDVASAETCEVSFQGSESLRLQVARELQFALGCYDAFLAVRMAGHTRAMVRRQRQTLSDLQEDLQRALTVEVGV